MSNFYCPECYAYCEDTPRGYSSWCSHHPREFGESPERGVLYFLSAGGKRGGKHAVQLATSLWSLRESGAWSGAVHLMCADDAASEVGTHLKKADPLLTTQDVRYDQKRVRCYSAKTWLGDWSPFKLTVYLDADTVVRGDIKELWPLHNEIVFTRFCEWSAGDPKSRIINSRIKKWAEYAPATVRMALTMPRPAINTGVVGFSRDTTFFEPWKNLCARCPKMFLGDETAAQVLLAVEQEWRCVDSRFNRSGWLESDKADDTRIWHLHGGKVLTSKCAPLWLPHFRAASAVNYAGINDWYPKYFPELAERMAKEKDSEKAGVPC